MKFTIIGIDDNREQHLSPHLRERIARNSVFSGGLRHKEIMDPYLPEGYSWIPIVVPLSQVFEAYRRHEEVVIFASGDPLFFGFANTVLREMPEAEIDLYPYFNSLQLHAHRLLLPYQDMKIVSLTGRPWHKFDEALILGYDLIGILTDNKEHTPQTIAERMLEYGYDNYKMSVGELLGNTEAERVTTHGLEEIASQSFAFPNNIILHKQYTRPRPFGLHEGNFHLLNGRAKMITKMPIRLLSLSALDLRERSVFWDVGFCTGSVSIEAKLQFPHLQVYAFEQREEGRMLIHENAKKFGTPGINAFIGDFTETETDALPAPDAAFIGGHGGKMNEIVEKLSAKMASGSILVFNAVSPESRQMFLDACGAHGFGEMQSTRITIDDFNPIEVMRAVKP